MLNLSGPANEALEALTEGIFQVEGQFQRDVKLFYLRLEVVINKFQAECQAIDRKVADEAMFDWAEYCYELPKVDLSSESERHLIQWEQTLKSP
jgi:hypothetical protein